MSEKLSTDSPEIMSPERPIRSINQKMVLVAFLTAILAIFAIIYLIPSSPKELSDRKHTTATFMEGRKFPELQQLPESYDNIEANNQDVVSEPIDTQFQEPVLPPESMPSRPTNGEQDAAHRSPVLFSSEHQRPMASDPIIYAPTTSQKSSLIFNQKEQFLQGSGSGDPGSLQRTSSPYRVLQGTLIPAVLVSTINSDLPGPILAQVTDNIFNTTTGKFLLIPQGTKIIGEYNSSVSNGQQRAQVVWSRLIFPNGNSMDLGRMPSVDGTGASGHQGSVNNHYDKLALGVLVTSLLSSGVGFSSGPANPGAASPQQIIGQSVGQEVARVGTKMAERSLDVPQTISVQSGTKINVFTMSDLQLVPYQF